MSRADEPGGRAGRTARQASAGRPPRQDSMTAARPASYFPSAFQPVECGAHSRLSMAITLNSHRPPELA
jgi:hypothetical protein